MQSEGIELTKSHLNSTKRFGNRVDDYAKYRPSYPIDIFNLINSKYENIERFDIADIGSGTGILTKLLLELGQEVCGVEPNLEMRSYAENWLGEYNNFKSIDGTAENTNLADKSVDLITVAQAFHWFETIPTKKEFLRIIKENGSLLLVWNDRKIETEGFSFEYENLIRNECPQYNEITHKNIDDKMIESFYAPNKVEKILFDNTQEFSFEELVGRLKSSSYVPVDDTEKMKKILTELEIIFGKYNQNGKIKFEYNTTVYFGRLK